MHKRPPQILGAALVELAIVLPVIVSVGLMLLLAAQTSFLQAYAELAMISTQFGFQNAPHKISPDPVTLQPGLQRLSALEAQAFVDELHSDIVESLRDSGSFSDPESNVAVELWYLDINPDTGQLARTPTPWRLGSPKFFTGPGATSRFCFESTGSRTYNSALREFDRYIESRLRLLSSMEAEGLFLGEKLIDSRLVGGSALYMESKAIIFVMTCSKRPVRVFNDNPVLRTFVFLPDSEAAWN